MHSVHIVLSLAAFWLACSAINLTWYKHHPDVIAEEFHPALIILAPLASFFVIFGMAGVYLYRATLRLMGIAPSIF
jgi:hypothetical protein